MHEGALRCTAAAVRRAAAAAARIAAGDGAASYAHSLVLPPYLSEEERFGKVEASWGGMARRSDDVLHARAPYASPAIPQCNLTFTA